MPDIFAIAASLTINGGSAMRFLEDFGAKLLETHGHMRRLESQLGNIQKLALGIGTAFAGYEMIKGVLHLAEHGKELNHQQSMLLRNGIAYRDVIDETTKAYQRYTAAVPTASGPDFLRTANELVSVKGTLKGADEALVQSLKIEGLIGNATGKSAEGQGYDFWRAVEDKGVIQNKALTDTVLNAMAQGTIATGGKISGSDWYTYARRAGTSWMGDSLDTLPLQVMEMQTMSASGAGQARRTLANLVEGGVKMTEKQTSAWSRIGMMGDDGKIAGHEIEQTRIDLWMQKAIDSLNKSGLSTFDQVKAWSSTAMSRAASAYFMTAYSGMTERDPETGKTRLEKERMNLGRAEGLDKAYDTMMKTDMTANMAALNTQWHSLMEAVGGPLAKVAIPALQDFTSAFQKMGEFADKHQDFTRIAGELTAVAGGVLLLGGSVTALRAALAISGFLKGGSGAAAGTLAGAVGHGPGRSPSGPSGAKFGPNAEGAGSMLWKLAGPAGLAYDIYNMGDPNSKDWQDTRGANQKALSDVVRGVRDMLPNALQSALKFSDDPMPAGARPSFPHTPTPRSALERVISPPPNPIVVPQGPAGEHFHEMQKGFKDQPFHQPDRPHTPTPLTRQSAEGLLRGLGMLPGLPLGWEPERPALKMPARPYTPTPGSAVPPIDGIMEKAIQGQKAGIEKAVDLIPKTVGDRLAKSTKDMVPAVDKAVQPIGDTIKSDVGKIPGAVAPAIASAFHALSAQISAAVAGLAAIKVPSFGVANKTLPDPIPGAINYRPQSYSVPPARQHTAMVTIHNTTTLDGKVIERSVTQRQARIGRFPTSVGSMDTHGFFGSPGTPMTDSA